MREPCDPLELTTPRLVLRPLAATDAELMHGVWTSPGVRRFLFDDEILPFSRTCEMLERNTRLFAEQGFGLWGARALADAGFIAFGGFWYFRDPPELELVYGVVDDEWGRGYATELTRALVEQGLGPRKMACIRASTDVGNRGSIRVLEKVGFRFTRQTRIGTLDTLFYELRR